MQYFVTSDNECMCVIHFTLLFIFAEFFLLFGSRSFFVPNPIKACWVGCGPHRHQWPINKNSFQYEKNLTTK